MDYINITGAILPLKERDKITDSWLKSRLETVLPKVMNNHQLDMWVMVSREYNEDPIISTFFPSSVDSSRRLTILVFYLNENGEIDRYVIGSPYPQMQSYYSFIWDYKNESQWECLARIVNEKNPKKIAINHSDSFSQGDGLTTSFYKKLVDALAPLHHEKLVSAESLVVEWLETRCEEEMTAYPWIVELARIIAAEALSNKVIHPGITTTEDVVYWIRQRVLDLGIKTSFYPTVDIQRCGAVQERLTNVTIVPGDVIHLDFGIEYLNLSTDTQLLAYVLRLDEDKVPDGLIHAMKVANRMEEIIQDNFIESHSGNEIFANSIQQAKQENIKAMIYSHPIGTHCHGAGPLIGLYDQQKTIPIKGDLKIKNNTCYAMEFNIKQYIPEWKQEVPIYLEETVAFTNGKLHFLTNRQTEFYLIK